MKKQLFLLASASLLCMPAAHAQEEDGPTGCDELVAKLSFEGDLTNSGTRALSAGEVANGTLRVMTEGSYVEDGKSGKAFHFDEVKMSDYVAASTTTDTDGNTVEVKAVRSAAAIDVEYYAGLRMLGDTLMAVQEDGTVKNNNNAASYQDDEGSFTVSLYMRSTGEFGGATAYLFHKGTWDNTLGNGNFWVGVEANSTKKQVFFTNKNQVKNKKQEIVIIGDGITGQKPGDTSPDGSRTISWEYVFDGEWHNIVVCRDHKNGTIYAYVDGYRTVMTAFSKMYNYSFGGKTGFAVGNSVTAGTNDEAFTGDIDEVQVFHGCATEDRVNDLARNREIELVAKTVEYDRDGTCIDPTASALQTIGVSAAEVAQTEYYTLGGQKVSAPMAKGIYIIRLTLTDGTTKSTKVIVK